MIFGPAGWPSRWAWKAAAVMTLVSLALIFLGTAGQVIFAVLVGAALGIGVYRRVQAVDPDEEFRNSRPDE